VGVVHSQHVSRGPHGARPGTESTGRWAGVEHKQFLKGIATHGTKNWGAVADLVQSRTVLQVRTHAQKYFKKLTSKTKKGKQAQEQLDAQKAKIRQQQEQENTEQVQQKQNSFNDTPVSAVAVFPHVDLCIKDNTKVLTTSMKSESEDSKSDSDSECVLGLLSLASSQA